MSTLKLENGQTVRKGKSSILINIFDDYRSLSMVYVCTAILAVDFPPIFPRGLCKTEEFGISLMDTGVAVMTLNSGFSGNKARPWWSNQNKMTFL